MSGSSDLEPVVGQLCNNVAYLMGRMQAYELYLQSLAAVVIDKYPELREPLKEDFVGVCELHRHVIKVEVTLASFDDAVKILTQHFQLMRGGGFFQEK